MLNFIEVVILIYFIVIDCYRKRTSQPTIKEKTAENGKLTMYDLIHDTVSSTPRLVF